MKKPRTASRWPRGIKARGKTPVPPKRKPSARAFEIIRELEDAVRWLKSGRVRFYPRLGRR